MKWLRIDSFPLEFLTAFHAMLWGFWLALPTDSFSSSSAYSVMASVAPETLWGLLFLFIGAVQMVILLKWNTHWIARGRISTLMLLLWTFVDVGFFASGSSSAAAMTYVHFVVASAWCVVALAYRARVI